MLVVDGKEYYIQDLQSPVIEITTSWFPQTIGWKLLFFVFIIVFVYKSYKNYQKWIENKYRREALAEIKNISFDDTHKAAQRLSKILKTTAIYALPSSLINSLKPEELSEKLNDSCLKKVFISKIFNDWQVKILQSPENNNFTDKEVKEISIQVTNWIINHQKEVL